MSNTDLALTTRWKRQPARTTLAFSNNCVTSMVADATGPSDRTCGSSSGISASKDDRIRRVFGLRMFVGRTGHGSLPQILIMQFRSQLGLSGARCMAAGVVALRSIPAAAFWKSQPAVVRQRVEEVRIGLDRLDPPNRNDALADS